MKISRPWKIDMRRSKIHSDITITVTTEEQSWFLDLATSEWILDLRMSIFHGRLIFMLNTEVEDTAD
jgi:hypothetical protein